MYSPQMYSTRSTSDVLTTDVLHPEFSPQPVTCGVEDDGGDLLAAGGQSGTLRPEAAQPLPVDCLVITTSEWRFVILWRNGEYSSSFLRRIMRANLKKYYFFIL